MGIDGQFVGLDCKNLATATAATVCQVDTAFLALPMHAPTRIAALFLSPPKNSTWCVGVCPLFFIFYFFIIFDLITVEIRGNCARSPSLPHQTRRACRIKVCRGHRGRFLPVTLGVWEVDSTKELNGGISAHYPPPSPNVPPNPSVPADAASLLVANMSRTAQRPVTCTPRCFPM